MLTIPALLVQMPPAVTSRLTADADALVPVLSALHSEAGHTPRAILLTSDERGWSVVVDGVACPAMRTRQAGSRGGWPSMRHALLAAILLAGRPELPVWGV